MRKNEEDHGAKLIHILTCVLAGGGIAFGIGAAVLAVSAVLISAGRLGEGAMEQTTLCAGLLGCLVGGVYGVLRCRSRVLPVGLGVAVVCYLLWLTVGLVTCGGVSVLGGNLRVLCACLLGGAVAGFLGARPKKRRK